MNALRFYVISGDNKIIHADTNQSFSEKILDCTNHALVEYGFTPSNWLFVGTATECAKMKFGDI